MKIAIRNKRKKTQTLVIFLHHNACPYGTSHTMANIQKLKWNLTRHPLHKPDLRLLPLCPHKWVPGQETFGKAPPASLSLWQRRLSVISLLTKLPLRPWSRSSQDYCITKSPHCWNWICPRIVQLLSLATLFSLPIKNSQHHYDPEVPKAANGS